MRNWPLLCSVWICRQGIYRNRKSRWAFRWKLLYISTSIVRCAHGSQSRRFSLYTSKERQIFLQTQFRSLSVTTRWERESLEVKWNYFARKSSGRACSNASLWKQRAQISDHLKTWNCEARNYVSRRLSHSLFRWAFQKLHLRICRRKNSSTSLGGIYSFPDSRQNFGRMPRTWKSSSSQWQSHPHHRRSAGLLRRCNTYQNALTERVLTKFTTQDDELRCWPDRKSRISQPAEQ